MKNDDEGDTAGDMTEMTEITVREYRSEDVKAMNEIWNEVVEDGIAFPQEECLDETSGMEFFAGQTYCAVAGKQPYVRTAGALHTCIRTMSADADI